MAWQGRVCAPCLRGEHLPMWRYAAVRACDLQPCALQQCIPQLWPTRRKECRPLDAVTMAMAIGVCLERQQQRRDRHSVAERPCQARWLRDGGMNHTGWQASSPLMPAVVIHSSGGWEVVGEWDVGAPLVLSGGPKQSNAAAAAAAGQFSRTASSSVLQSSSVPHVKAAVYCTADDVCLLLLGIVHDLPLCLCTGTAAGSKALPSRQGPPD